MWMPPWYGDFKTGDRVKMRYINPASRTYGAGTSTTECEGVLDRFSMEPIEGYPWNATPHSVSLAVIDDHDFEHRAPINRIIELHPLTDSATVRVGTPDD